MTTVCMLRFLSTDLGVLRYRYVDCNYKPSPLRVSSSLGVRVLPYFVWPYTVTETFRLETTFKTMKSNC